MRRASEFVKLPEVFFILGWSSKHKKPESLKNELLGSDNVVACVNHASRRGHYGNVKQLDFTDTQPFMLEA
jgi:hypothetical protein